MADKSGVGTFVTDELELLGNGLDLFTPPPVENALVHGKTVYHYPVTAVTNTGPYTFLIPSEGNDYTYLPYTRLEGEISVTALDGSAITDSIANSLVNLFPQTLFSQIECEVNGVSVNDISTSTYPLKAFIETHLTYGDDAKKTTLACEYYEKDEVGKESELIVADTTSKKANTRVKNSHALLKKGKRIPFSMILHVDFFHSQRYLPPGCNLKLKLIRSRDEYTLLGASVASKINIHDLKLRTRRITVDSRIVEEHETKLNSSPMIFPITQSTITNHLLNAGNQTYRLSRAISGKIPRCVIIGFLKSTAFDGAVNTNPFSFGNFGLNYMQMYVGGEPILAEAFKPNFEDGLCIREYRHFMDNIGIAHENETNGITLEDFKSNSCFFAFDLTPDLCNGMHFHGINSGTIDLSLGFKTALTENLTVIIFSSSSEIITIDKERNISFVP